ERGDADRAPRPVDHLDALGQQLVDPVPDDRVGLPAADLHDRPTVPGGRMDVVHQSAGQLRVVELVDVFHRFTSLPPATSVPAGPCAPASRAARPQASPNSSSMIPRPSNSSSVSRAEASSSRWMAKPTCTIA